MSLRLLIGSFNVSGRSLAVWLVLEGADLVVQLERIDLRREDAAEELARKSPTGRLPVLFLDTEAISEPLAIAEFAAEHRPGLWPEGREARARARAVAEEALYGFPDLVTFLPLDLSARFEPPGKLLRRVERDLERLFALWRELLARAGGKEFLLGPFSIADAFMVPHAARMRTYALTVEEDVRGYVERLLALPAVECWCAWARAEVAGERLDGLSTAARRAEAAPEPEPTAAAPTAPEKATAPIPASPASAGEAPAPAARPRAPESLPPEEGPQAAAATAAPPPRPRLFAPRRFPFRAADTEEGGAAAAPSSPAPPPASRPEEEEARAVRRRTRTTSREPPIKPIGGGILRRRSRTRPA